MLVGLYLHTHALFVLLRIVTLRNVVGNPHNGPSLSDCSVTASWVIWSALHSHAGTDTHERSQRGALV